MSTSYPDRQPRYAIEATADLLAPMTQQVETLGVDNISVGGAFLQTWRPYPLGSTFRLRLPLEDGVVRTSARVVHVVHPSQARRKQLPAGMGVAFIEMDAAVRRMLWGCLSRLSAQPSTRPSKLQRFSHGLPGAASNDTASAETQARGPELAPARLISASRAELRLPDAETLLRLWHRGLSRGQFFAQGDSLPRLGDKIEVTLIGVNFRLDLHARAVRLLDSASARAWGRESGALLELLDFATEARDQLNQLLPASQIQ